MTEPCSLCRPHVALHEDRRWRIHHIAPPWGVAGWMILAARRHVASLAELDDDEAGDLGPTLRRAARALREVTSAERIYTATIGEAVPHFHVHLVPRAAAAPRRGFALFDLERAAAAGEIAVAADEVARISDAFSAALRRA